MKGGAERYMTTPSSEITDLFLSRIRDYRLDTLFSVSGSTTLVIHTEPWLLNSISDFEDVADQSLAYTVSDGTSEGYFTETLSMKNKLMLAKIMTKHWMAKNVQDVIQFNNVISDRDYKTFSAAQNLKAKQDYYNNLQEEISQDLVNYAYKRASWDSWYNQIFSA